MSSSLSAFYARSFAQHPWITLGVTNGGLSMVADALAQGLAAGSPTETPGYDTMRGMRFLAFGAAMAPLLAEWNRFIELRFPLRSVAPALPSHVEMRGVGEGVAKEVAAQGRVSLRALAKRVVVDQGCFAPFGLALFVGFMGVTEGRAMQGPGGLSEKFSEVYWPALLANWKVWPLIQTINFRFMPLRYRVPFVSCCGVGWTIFLSMLQGSSKDVAAVEVLN